MMIENKGKRVDELIHALYGGNALNQLSVTFDKYVKKHQQILADGNVGDDKIGSYHR